MIIYHNITAMQSHRQMKGHVSNVAKISERLSSGLRINRSADDAAGLSISEKMRAQIRGLDQSSRNGQDGVSLIQTAEGAMNEMQSMMQRMRELCVQKATDTLTEEDRACIDREIIQLLEANDHISETTTFNTKVLLDGTFFMQKFQIGANTGQSVDLSISDLTNMGLNLPSSMMIPLAPPIADSEINVDIVNTALKKVSEERSKLGAAQNRLEYSINNLNNASENLQQSESRIRDSDIAREMMEYSKSNVLKHSTQNILRQANQNPQRILELLK